MENVFSHELVGVIKRACFSRHGISVRPTLLVIGNPQSDLLLSAVLEELALDSTLSLNRVTTHDAVALQQALSVATVILMVTDMPCYGLEQVHLSQKPLLIWGKVKRDTCPLFWPAHSVMDFFIVHQDSLLAMPQREVPKGEEK